MLLEQVNKEEWVNWKEHPITEHFFAMIKGRREDLIELLAYGNIESPKKQDVILGTIGAYTQIMGVTFEDASDGK